MGLPPKANACHQNYFTCTLGEASQINYENPSEFRTINDLLDIQAKRNPQSPAVAFPVPNKSSKWSSKVLSFQDLQRECVITASGFSRSQAENSRGAVAGLLCTSSLDFLFAWLGLMRAGFAVLLIAPQCQPSAITHLCKECNISVLFHDEQNSRLASSAADSTLGLKSELLFWQSQNKTIQELLQTDTKLIDHSILPKQKNQDVAYIHHTSGTSSGLPKPIYQTHQGGVGVLPCFEGQESATFTTTPLYHGGIADCFRAWTSTALIWLFPASDVPITSHSILLSILSTNQSTLPSVKYFSSVPYVLQMLAEDVKGMEMLQTMEIVGVGGASLPANIGDELVKQRINLVSRFGSSEAGFLLSSHRDYIKDKEWQFLRVSPVVDQLHFEPQDDDSSLSELVIKPQWPHLAKQNREDGSLDTSDLFEPHPELPRAWKYHSRSDSQITLITGKKFDPAPLEDAISSSSPLIRDILIFGSGQQVPGSLVFCNTDAVDESVEIEVWKVINKSNENGQRHTNLSRNMVVIMPLDSRKIEKSSKGTINRKAAEETFKREIESVYQVGEESTTTNRKLWSTLDDLTTLVRSAIQEVLSHGNHLDEDSNFYQHGIDSITCTKIRESLAKVSFNVLSIEKTITTEQNIDLETNSLPWNVVYDCGNITRLSQYLYDLCKIGSARSTESSNLLEIARQYSSFTFPARSRIVSAQKSHVVLLTGATGALGANILDILRKDANISQIFCLVRASSDDEARVRVSESLSKRRKPPLHEHDQTIVCLASQLGSVDLGVSSHVLGDICKRTSIIIHAAWAVNFALSLNSFIPDHIAGLQNYINVAGSCQNLKSFVFCSSTASILGESSGSPHREQISTDPKAAGTLGYSQSKWVAERICFNASQTGNMKNMVKIARIGQLTGDTEHGVWNFSEAFPLMLSTAKSIGCLPLLEERVDWLPLDTAAQAVIDISLNNSDSRGCPVYHVVNHSPGVNWNTFLCWIKEASSKNFDIVEFEVWAEKLEKLESHPAKRLLGFWRDVYGVGKAKSEPATFEVEHSRAASKSLQQVGPVDALLADKIWNWLQ